MADFTGAGGDDRLIGGSLADSFDFTNFVL